MIVDFYGLLLKQYPCNLAAMSLLILSFFDFIQDGEADEAALPKELTHNITEIMRAEMEYNSDHAW